MKLIVALSLISSTASAEVLSLNPGNFDELTAGKTVFIKYFAPWCGHCQSMAADWETLATEWENNPIGLVAEVDCDNQENDALCQAAGVQGFPTIKYGDPSELQDYNGGRDLQSLTEFANENLKPTCSLSNLDLCSDEKKASIAKYQGMGIEDLQTILSDAQAKMTAAEENMEQEIEKLQAKYEELTKESEEVTKKAKEDADFALVSAILKSKGGTIPGNDMPDFDDDEEMDDSEDSEDGAQGEL